MIPPEPTYEPYNLHQPLARLLPSDGSLVSSMEEQFATPSKDDHLKLTPKYTPIAPAKVH